MRRFRAARGATPASLRRIRNRVKARFGYRLSREQLALGLALFELADKADALRLLREGLLDPPSFEEEYWFFSPSRYRSQASNAGIPVSSQIPPLLHWLIYGIEARLVPYQAFDETYYLARHPSVRQSGQWAFAHFVAVSSARTDGLRAPRKTPIPDAYRRNATRDSAEFYLARERDYEASRDRVLNIIGRDEFKTIVEEFQDSDPSVGNIFASDVDMAPFHDDLHLHEHQARQRLPRKSYDTIVCVPWIRMGGADLVASVLTKSLARLRPDERLLFLQIDSPIVEWPDIVPSGVDVADLSDIFMSIGGHAAERLLLAIFRGLAPRRILNVNSRLCWSVFDRFGERLARETGLYSYLFCWDRTPEGTRAGYPSTYFPSTAPFLAGAITDTFYLRDELTHMYRPPPAVRRRLVTLRTPARMAPRAITVAEEAAGRLGARRRPRVLWAGRLDRQKRFDLVEQIAALMPDVDFECWGAPVLDAPASTANRPANLVLHKPFAKYEELPLLDCDGWLYTSAWDGMPTILVELANMGTPIVASAVEGVCELIAHDTGWPVAAWEAGAYVAALRDMIASPQERVRRARNLQFLATREYCTHKYDKDLAALLAMEESA